MALLKAALAAKRYGLNEVFGVEFDWRPWTVERLSPGDAAVMRKRTDVTDEELERELRETAAAPELRWGSDEPPPEVPLDHQQQRA